MTEQLLKEREALPPTAVLQKRGCSASIDNFVHI